jgi:hypothetical protein
MSHRRNSQRSNAMRVRHPPREGIMSPKIVFRDISHRDKSLAIAHVGASCNSKRASSDRSARNIQKGGLLSPKTCFRDKSPRDKTTASMLSPDSFRTGRLRSPARDSFVVHKRRPTPTLAKGCPQPLGEWFPQPLGGSLPTPSHPPTLGTHKRIRPLLTSDRRRRPMARQNHRAVRQRVQLLDD